MDPWHTELMRHLHQGDQVACRAVDAARRDQAQQVQRVPFADISHGPQQNRVPLEASVANREVDPGQVLVDDPPGADIEVANLGVPLLTLR